MTNSGRTKQTETPHTSEQFALGEVDLEIARIRRIGKKYFDVANCVVTFENASPVSSGIVSIETAFCRSFPLSSDAVVVPDTRNDPFFSQHRMVTGAPNVRFFASHPIYNKEKTVVGAISLVDYAPRIFREADRQMLADLAALVQRELHIRSMNALQIDLEKKNKNLRRKSLIDPLIGIWNRGAIMRILNIESARCDKSGMPLSLIVADLDYFKKINDTYGHPAGDAVLVKVGGRLRACIRSQEALGRYGGEEFIIVLPGSSSSTAVAVAERMRRAVASQPEAVAGNMLNLTISAGVASTDLFSTATTEELISRADVALYSAKDAGRNCVMQAKPDFS